MVRVPFRGLGQRVRLLAQVGDVSVFERGGDGMDRYFTHGAFCGLLVEGVVFVDDFAEFFEGLLQEIGIVVDILHRGVDLVRDPGGQLAHRSNFLRLQQLRGLGETTPQRDDGGGGEW